jgi:hypothetical protein
MNCPPGSDGCPCYGNMTCDDALLCTAGFCEQPECPEGTLGCSCYGNMTCDDELVCAANLCEPIPDP